MTETITLVHQNVVFEDQTVYLSGKTFLDCTFRRCTFVLRESLFGALSGCKFDGCIWHLDFLVHDHHQWDGFIKSIVPLISQTLPRTTGEKQK